MAKLTQHRLAVKSGNARRITLLLVLGLAVFLPMRVSVAESFEKRTDEVRRHEEKRVVLNPCSQRSVRLDPFKYAGLENALRVASSAPRPTPHPALRFDDDFGVVCTGGDIQCSGPSCVHQCLGCPTGWTATAVGACCGKCCQGDNCGEETCCTSR